MGGSRPDTGFTLLEMVLVVGILSALALSAMSFVDNRDDQARFELSQRRLLDIRYASIGAEGRTDSFVPGGFVADNGQLPATIDTLLSRKPAGWEDHGLKTPVFDATPDARTGLNNDASDTLIDTSAAKLVKGWRPAYLLAPPGAVDVFRDGWGTPGAAPNHGWVVDSSLANSISITSLGKDGVAGGTDYAADMTSAIESAHWSSDVASLKVRVVNRVGIDLGMGATTQTDGRQRLRISLLVYENGSAGRWKRYTSELPCLEGTGDMVVGTTVCADTTTVSFSSDGCDNTTNCTYSSSRLPLGRHLLLVVKDPDGSAHTTDDKPYPDAGVLVQPLLCTAAGCPQETIILR